MKTILAVVATLLIVASAHGQYVTAEQCQLDAIGWVAVPAQCNGCCPPSCGPGGCYGQPWSPPPQRYAPPRQQAQPEPKYEVRPQKPLVPVQPVTPAMPAPQKPPSPTIDAQALAEHEKSIKEALAQQLKVEQSILVAIKEQPRCNCQPTDLTQINARIDALTKAVANLKVSPPAPAPAASGTPAFYIDVRPHKEN